MQGEGLAKDQLRKLDNKAKQVLGIPENILIENASRGIAEVLSDRGLLSGPICIFAGRGNNSADSLALARHLLVKKVDLRIYLVFQDKKPNLQVEFQLNILNKIIGRSRIKVLNNKEDFSCLAREIKEAPVSIDGIFGIGFEPPLASFYEELFSIINNNAGKTLAIDIPSGLCCDSGKIDKKVIRANITVTFIAPKKGLFLRSGPGCSGEVILKDIGVSGDILKKI